jgi:hypothetical protein
VGCRSIDISRGLDGGPVNGMGKVENDENMDNSRSEKVLVDASGKALL